MIEKLYGIAIFRHTLYGHKVGVDMLEFSKDGSRCVSWDSTTRDLTVHMWNVKQGTYVRKTS